MPYPTLCARKSPETLRSRAIYPTELPRAYSRVVRTGEISETSETLECVDTVGVIAFGE